MKNLLGLGGWLLACFAVAGVGGLFMPGEWYARLAKPSWNPPSWVFAPVWTLLYTVMAVAAWLVWKRGGFAQQWPALGFFLVQLLFNGLWSPLFFGLRQPGLALVDLCLMWAALLGTIRMFWSVQPLAGGLLLPYLAWISFAGALNFAVWRLNR
jgi:tryptophan-rich sensory protein